jgi:hypothetical protein
MGFRLPVPGRHRRGDHHSLEAVKPACVSLMVVALLATAPLTACGGPAVVCGGAETTAPTGFPATPEPQAYPWEAVDYFVEIAFGCEFGNCTQEVTRWTDDVKIAVHGDPNQADLATLCDVVADLNELIGTVEISVVGSGQNVDLYFVPEDRFAVIEPNYVPGTSGQFWTWRDGAGSITEARVLVSTSEPVQEQRNHIIREELTQFLGLMQDSYTYPDSIFYQEWSEVQEYSALDEKVIEILYLPQITPGMTIDEARAALSSR